MVTVVITKLLDNGKVIDDLPLRASAPRANGMTVDGRNATERLSFLWFDQPVTLKLNKRRAQMSAGGGKE